LKGFAITTMIGISIGVFITRPALEVVAENVLKHEEV
jgi:preprotein translocase subunit SecD